MMNQAKHSLVLNLDSKPYLLELKVAAIVNEGTERGEKEIHRVLESAEVPLVPMTDEVRDGLFHILYGDATVEHRQAVTDWFAEVDDRMGGYQEITNVHTQQ